MNAEIVDRDRDVIFAASFERDLELARQRRAEAMTQQEPRQRLGVRRDVEQFVGRRSGVRACGDVADRVAARFAGGDPDVRQQPHRRLDVVQLDEVELDVLTRGDVAEAARVRVADFGERASAGRLVITPCGIFTRSIDASCDLALSVRAAQQAERAPLVRRDLAALVLLEHDDELVDIGFVGERQPRAPVRIYRLVCR